MKTIAIIAEFNPLHTGHLRLLQEAQAHNPDANIIIIMSGSFVQRGKPAIFSKFQRTAWALQCGAHAVFELPTIYSLGNAEIFASGAVRIALTLGADILCFGSESACLDDLTTCKQLMQQDKFKEELQDNLKKGLSYGSALRQTLSSICNHLSYIVNKPNDILGLEYMKAIDMYGPHIKVLPVLRTSQHHSQSKEDEFASGTAIRQAIYDKSWSSIKKFIPEPIQDSYLRNLQEGTYVDPNRYNDLILGIGRHTSLETIKNTAHCNEGLENKCLQAFQETNWLVGRDTIKSKRYTYSRIDRLMACLILGISQRTMKEAHLNGPSYCRLLGMQSQASTLLRHYQGAIPIINKWGAFMKELNKKYYSPHTKINEILNKENLNKINLQQKLAMIDIKASDIQHYCFHNQEKRQGGLDYQYSPLFLK